MRLKPPPSWSAKRFHRRTVFAVDDLKSRRLSPDLQLQLKNDGYRFASSNSGLRMVIIGPTPLFDELSDWCWTGSYKQFLQLLVSETVVEHGVKTRRLRKQFSDWLNACGADNIIVKYKANNTKVKVIFPHVGKWHGKFVHFCHAIAIGYPNVHNVRSVLSRRRTWMFSDDLPNDEKLTDLVYSYGKEAEFTDLLSRLNNPLLRTLQEEMLG